MPTLYGTFTRIDLADGVLVAMADDTTVRVCCADAPTRADLAADVARLERANADLTRERDDSRRLALAAAMERDQRTSDLAIAHCENERLRAQLDAQPPHRAAGDAVDLRVWVRRSDVKRLCDREARTYRDASRYSDAFAVGLIGALVNDGLELPPEERDLRGEAVEGGEQEAVEGAGGHSESLSPATGCRESRGLVSP